MKLAVKDIKIAFSVT